MLQCLRSPQDSSFHIPSHYAWMDSVDLAVISPPTLLLNTCLSQYSGPYYSLFYVLDIRSSTQCQVWNSCRRQIYCYSHLICAKSLTAYIIRMHSWLIIPYADIALWLELVHTGLDKAAIVTRLCNSTCIAPVLDCLPLNLHIHVFIKLGCSSSDAYSWTWYSGPQDTQVSSGGYCCPWLINPSLWPRANRLGMGNHEIFMLDFLRGS